MDHVADPNECAQATYALEKTLLVAEGASIDLSLVLGGGENLGWEFVGQRVGIETLLQGLVSVDLALTFAQLFQLIGVKGHELVRVNFFVRLLSNNLRRSPGASVVLPDRTCPTRAAQSCPTVGWPSS